MTSAIIVEQVTKRYGELTAVAGLSLEIPPGRTVALLGPNGAGKSTTIGMLMGLVQPDAGLVRIAGGAPRAAVRAGRIAAMLQDCGLMPGVTAGELVALARSMCPAPLRGEEALELAGLRDLAGRRVERMSGGEAQRLKFALVAVANPDIMLLDEPTRALDVAGRIEFWAAMRRYAASGRTIVFATHYLDEVDENADRVVVMARGRIVADGAPGEIREAGGGAVVRFRVPPGTAPAGLPGQVTLERGWVTIRTGDADAAVRILAAGQIPWSDLRVAPPSLDDTFLHLTAGQGADIAAEATIS